MDVFNNYRLKTNITRINGGWIDPEGFAMDSTKTRYYISDWTYNKIYILNNEYQYISEKSFNFPKKIISIGNNMYISGRYIWKTDRDLNVLIQFDGTNSLFMDIYFNSTNTLMYVPSYYLNSIQVFDLNLN